ncbi:MAG: ribbon-helix-helix domain-containing protein [Candidatus Asgardarchaeia archaeon]
MPESILVQVRIPEKLLKKVEKLCKEGYYRSKGEVIIDAIRHLLERYEQKDEIEKLTELSILGKVPKKKSFDLTDITIDVDEDTILKNISEYFGTENIDEIINRLRRRL